MMKPANICFMVCWLSLSAGSLSADRIITVEPGLWEYTHTLEIPGLLDPISSPKTECISPDEAQQSLYDLLRELSDDAGCTVTNLKDNLNTVKFDLACSADFESMSLQANGHLAFRYGRTAITGSATGSISIGEAEMTVNASGAANRIGRCTE